ncbi:MAG: N-acetylmuramoyl-L-alanine amidase family protein [Cellulosilyticaceae bacterium]
MKYLVILDAGHGMDTAGKRTPLFEDGSFMHEREFNKAVVQKVINLLKDYDTEVMWVSESDQDVPLKIRSDRANAKYQQVINSYGKKEVGCVFVSVHANASSDKWDTAQGIETFAHPESDAGFELAKVLQRRLIALTKLRDRGVKMANFAVLRQAQMPAALCECGFMNYKKEAELLRRDDYRELCAKAIFEGIVEYLKLPKKKEEVSKPVDANSVRPIRIRLNGKIKEVDAININGNNYIKLRDLQDDQIKVDYDGIPTIDVHPK